MVEVTMLHFMINVNIIMEKVDLEINQKENHEIYIIQRKRGIKILILQTESHTVIRNVQ